jgi:hypothetical protein
VSDSVSNSLSNRVPPGDCDKSAPVVIDSVYCHIGNGGVTFSVEDTNFGPEVVIESAHFGNNMHTQRVMVEPRVLARLGEMFAKAARHAAGGKFSPTYCHAADFFLREEWGGRDESGAGPSDGGAGAPGGPEQQSAG